MTVSADDLGRLLGISARRVRELAALGIVPKTGRGRYEQAASVLAYCEHLRAQAAGRAGDAQAGLAVERARLAREQADNVAMKNAALRRDLVSAGEVEARWSGVLRRVRVALLAVPSRVVAAAPHLTAHDADRIGREIRGALQEIADGAP